jgi:hypothetical protein
MKSGKYEVTVAVYVKGSPSWSHPIKTYVETHRSNEFQATTNARIKYRYEFHEWADPLWTRTVEVEL